MHRTKALIAPLTLVVFAQCSTIASAAIIQTGDVVIDPLGQFNVGLTATGTFTVDGGSDFSHSGGVFVGNIAGANGTVTVTGTGSTFTADGDGMVLGNGAVFPPAVPGAVTTGTLNIQAGGSVTTSTLGLGTFGGGANGVATGTINLSGATSSLQSTPFDIGRGGNGRVNLSDGTITATETSLGRNETSGILGDGQLHMSSGTFNAGSHLNVGFAGTGHVMLDGGTINTGSTNVGLLSGSSGQFDMSDGNLNASQFLFVANLAGANGQFDLSGGTITVGDFMGVGNFGSGVFDMTGGTVNSATTIVGFEAGSSGRLDMSDGTFNGTGGLTVGSEAGSNGQVNMSGGTLNLGGSLEVGRDGVGTFSMTGGEATTTFSTAGRNAGGDGTTTISGATATVTLVGNTTFGGFLTMSRGDGSQGEFTLTNEASLDMTTVAGAVQGGFQVSRNVGSDGTMTVSGDAQLNVVTENPFVHIVRRDAGTLNVTSGGDVTITGTGGVDYQSTIGRQDNGDGTLNINTGGTFTMTGQGGAQATLVLGRDLGTNGVVNISTGGTLDVDGTVEIARGGTGTATVSGTGVLEADTVIVSTGGSLGGDGTVIGAVSVQGGTVGPGNSAGTLLIDGGFSMPDGLLIIEIEGPTLFDVLDITGAASLTGGSILFDFIGGFGALGDSFDFLLAAGGLTDFSNVSTRTIGLGSGFDVLVLAGTNGLSVEVITATTPEPGTIVLLALGGLGIVIGRRCRTTTM